VPDSAAWELIQVNPATRLGTSGNTCVDARGAVLPCRGLASGITSQSGLAFRELGEAPLRDLAPGHQLYCADCDADRQSGACTGGGDGRFARKLRQGWTCD
jgi:hypothetical protein